MLPYVSTAVTDVMTIGATSIAIERFSRASTHSPTAPSARTAIETGHISSCHVLFRLSSRSCSA